MGMTFLILFAIAEITLVVLTFTKFGEKSAWLKNRAIVRAVETVLLFGMILLPTVHMRWRFFFTLVIVAVRFIFAGIMWLIRHKKIDGMKKKAWSVVNCVLSTILVAVSLVPAFIFTNYNGLSTTGKYTINEVSAILVDESRKDTFENDGSFREVPAHFYYPADADGEFPLVIFSHGAFGYYQSNFSTYAELASNGYVVVALDHPHHAFFTKDTSGKTVIVDSQFINDAAMIQDMNVVSAEDIFKITNEWMKLRCDDIRFVIDSIKSAKANSTLNKAWNTENTDIILKVLSATDTEKIGCMGHSLGGAASIELGRNRNDIDAVIDFDGTALGEVEGFKNGKGFADETAYPVPVLVICRKIDYNKEEDPQNLDIYKDITDKLIENAADGKMAVFSGVGHMDFTDLPLFSPFFSKMLGGQDIDNEAMMNTVNGIVLDWFSCYLKNEGELTIKAEY